MNVFTVVWFQFVTTSFTRLGIVEGVSVYLNFCGTPRFDEGCSVCLRTDTVHTMDMAVVHKNEYQLMSPGSHLFNYQLATYF